MRASTLNGLDRFRELPVAQYATVEGASTIPVTRWSTRWPWRRFWACWRRWIGCGCDILTKQFNARIEARMGERTRIARDLHYMLLQSFPGCY